MFQHSRQCRSVWAFCAAMMATAVVAAEPARPPQGGDATVEVRIITLGDSITKGVRSGVTADQTFAALLEAELQNAGRNVTVTNVGIGGERTDQALKRLAKDVIAKRPHLVTIMYGTNDSYVDVGKEASRLSLDEYRANLKTRVARLRSAGIEPILMTEPRWGAAADQLGELLKTL